MQWHGEERKRELLAAIIDAVDESANEIKADMKRLGYAGAKPSKKSKRLPAGKEVKIGPTDWKAHFHEKGTKGHMIKPKNRKALFGGGYEHPVTGPIRVGPMRARPFVRPAFEKGKRSFIGKLHALGLKG